MNQHSRADSPLYQKKPETVPQEEVDASRQFSERLAAFVEGEISLHLEVLKPRGVTSALVVLLSNQVAIHRETHLNPLQIAGALAASVANSYLKAHQVRVEIEAREGVAG